MLHCTYLPIFGFYEGGCSSDFNKQGHVSAASVAAVVISHLGWIYTLLGDPYTWNSSRQRASQQRVLFVCIHMCFYSRFLLRQKNILITQKDI